MIYLKKITALLLVLCTLVLFFACSSGETENSEKTSTPVSGTFTVYTLSVGKADCHVLKTEDSLFVIDLGVKDMANEIVSFISSFGKKVDALLITHYDKDHIGAIKKFLGKFSVEKVYLPEYEEEKQENADEVKGYLTKHNITPVTVTEKISFDFDDVSFTIYPSDILFKRNDTGSNASSLVVEALHGQNDLLFTGDAEEKRLPEIITQLPDPARVNWLKVPHHGVYDNNSAAFFSAIAPAYAVITCSDAEPADGSTVKLLTDLGTEVFLTNGGVVTTQSDGTVLRVYYQTVTI